MAVALLTFCVLIRYKTNFEMDTDKNTTLATGAATDSITDAESFTKVKSKKTQKRKREQDGVDMDTEESVARKRPQFPPISGDKLKVTTTSCVTNTIKCI